MIEKMKVVHIVAAQTQKTVSVFPDKRSLINQN